MIEGFIYIFLTVTLTVYGQLIIKWQVNKVGAFPHDAAHIMSYLFHLCINPWVISVFLAAFLAALSWMVALTRFQLSYAYPFVSLTFVLVLILSAIFFHEQVTWPKAVGMICIITGLIIGSQG
ncbi:MAG: EamA family transporter [Chloroflexi bacterium]|nr:EamA family transporter [Chloroflexota bacterium]